MQKAIWKVLVLFLTLAGLCQQVLATPIVSQVSRSVLAQAFFDELGPMNDTDSNDALGSVDLSASASRSLPAGDELRPFPPPKPLLLW